MALVARRAFHKRANERKPIKKTGKKTAKSPGMKFRQRNPKGKSQLVPIYHKVEADYDQMYFIMPILEMGKLRHASAPTACFPEVLSPQQKSRRHVSMQKVFQKSQVTSERTGPETLSGKAGHSPGSGWLRIRHFSNRRDSLRESHRVHAGVTRAPRASLVAEDNSRGSLKGIWKCDAMSL